MNKLETAEILAPPDVEEYRPDNKKNENIVTNGLGNLLYHVHSTHMKNLLCAMETTSLQFYEHMVVATITSQLWCFPKRYQTIVIPRFKIVNAGFGLGPRSIPVLAYLIMAISLVLIIIGAVNGGCSKCDKSPRSSYYYYYNKDCDNSGACASLVIGCLLLVIPVPLLILLPIIWKWHFIYFDVKAPTTRFFNFGGIYSYAFRFKKIGFDTRTENLASFDEFYLIEYVYGSLGKAGSTVTSEAHLLSHFNHAALATPIVPIHADNTVRDLVMDGLKNRKKNVGESVAYAEV